MGVEPGEALRRVCLAPEKTSLPPLLQCTDTSSKRVFESTTDLSGKERSMSTPTLRLVLRCAEQKPSEVLSLPGSTQPDPRPDSSVTSTEAGQVCEKGKFSLCALHSNTHTSHLSPRGWREHPTAINVRNHDILDNFIAYSSVYTCVPPSPEVRSHQGDPLTHA